MVSLTSRSQKGFQLNYRKNCLHSFIHDLNPFGNMIHVLKYRMQKFYVVKIFNGVIDGVKKFVFSMRMSPRNMTSPLWVNPKSIPKNMAIICFT